MNRRRPRPRLGVWGGIPDRVMLTANWSGFFEPSDGCRSTGVITEPTTLQSRTRTIQAAALLLAPSVSRR